MWLCNRMCDAYFEVKRTASLRTGICSAIFYVHVPPLYSVNEKYMHIILGVGHHMGYVNVQY